MGKKKQNNKTVDIVAVTVSNFLEGYTPAQAYGPDVIVMTTDDIISSLSDMMDLTQYEVVSVMAELGFTPGRSSSGLFGWLLRRRN